MLEFLKNIILFFQKNNIDYMLSGSVALSLYTVPRATRDFDFVVYIKYEDADLFVENFKEGYYCDSDAIKDAIKHSSMFNIIDHNTGFKADFVVLKDSAFRKNEFERRIETEFFKMKVFIVSAEDLLISKLIWIQDYQSNLQLEDIKALLHYKALDISYIKSWIKNLNLNTFNLI